MTLCDIRHRRIPVDPGTVCGGRRLDLMLREAVAVVGGVVGGDDEL